MPMWLVWSTGSGALQHVSGAATAKEAVLEHYTKNIGGTPPVTADDIIEIWREDAELVVELVDDEVAALCDGAFPQLPRYKPLTWRYYYIVNERFSD